jgi:intein/homing endonuclease
MPDGREVEISTSFRKSVRAPEGHKLVWFDYSQIEYRLIAGYTKSKHLMRLYAEGVDMHVATAAFCFNIKPEDVTEELRRDGKVINFALAYGMGVPNFYRHLDGKYTMEQAAEIHARYFEMLPELVAFHERTRAMTDRTHSVETYFGRFQMIPEYKSTNAWDLSKARRAGVNRIIQTCCTGETMVYTDRGMIPFAFLKDARIRVWNGTRWVNATGYSSGLRPHWRVKLKNAPELHCSPMHPVLAVTDEGRLDWVKVADLKPGQYVAINAKPYEAGMDVRADFAELVGRLIGDGRDLQKSPLLMFHYEKELADRDFYAGVAASLGFDYTYVSIPKADGRYDVPALRIKKFAAVLRDLGCEWPSEKFRRVPIGVFQWNLAGRAAFLKGLFSADGGWSSDDKATIVFTTSKRQLCLDVQQLLMSCGIPSSWIFKENDGSGVYRLTVGDTGLYMRLIGFRQDDKQNHAYTEQSGSDKLPEPLMNAIHERYYRQLRGKGLTASERTMFSGKRMGRQSAISLLEKCGDTEFDYAMDFRYAEVEQVEDMQEQVEMFDLETDTEPYAYVANGIVSHNSAADIMKMAIVRVGRMLKEKYPSVKMILTIHDALMFVVPDTVDLQQFMLDVRERAEMQIDGFPRFVVDFQWGYTWADKNKVDLPREDASVSTDEQEPVLIRVRLPMSVTPAQLKKFGSLLTGEGKLEVAVVFNGTERSKLTQLPALTIVQQAESIGADVEVVYANSNT